MIAVSRRSRGGARKASSEKYGDLPTEEIHYEIPEEERACERCGGEMKEIGTDVRDEITIVPAQIKVTRHVMHKYACGSEECADESPL
jgi:transposase